MAHGVGTGEVGTVHTKQTNNSSTQASTSRRSAAQWAQEAVRGCVCARAIVDRIAQPHNDALNAHRSLSLPTMRCGQSAA